MKRAIVPVVVFFVIFGIAVAVTRLLQITPIQATLPIPVSALAVEKRNSVTCKGVSFAFDSALVSEVMAETIPAVDGDQLCDTAPEHLSFEFIGYRRRKELCCNTPTFRVFPVDQFRKAVSPRNQEEAKIFGKNAVDEEVRVLKLLLAKQPAPANIGSFLGKARGEKCCGAMPFLPLVEACMAFTARHKYMRFKNGKGILFLTQWDKETTRVDNGWLEYNFQGITDDGKYYVSADFPVAAPFLPDGDEPEVYAWNEKNYLLSHNSKEYQTYLRPLMKELEALPADKFDPSLDLIERMIQSLQFKP